MRPVAPGQPHEDGSFAARVQRLYGADLHWFLVDRLKSDQDAKDVMQEVYLRLLRLGPGELVREPRAYVYFVTRQVLAQFRLRVARSLVTYDSKLAQRLDPEQRVPDVAEHLMALGELEHVLESLPPLHSKVFVLRAFEGLSWAQIAEQLCISKHTVKKYLCEANARIGSMLRARRG
jgi:RNA polymerase sigma factor (sigma-70 family)